MSTTYTVKSGDSLSRIAANVLGNMAKWPQIAQLNNLAAPYRIYPGQVLQLPGSTQAAPAGMPVIPASTAVALTLPPNSGQPGSSGSVVQWLIDHKIIVGGALVGIAFLALAFGRKKSARRKPVHKSRKS